MTHPRKMIIFIVSAISSILLIMKVDIPHNVLIIIIGLILICQAIDQWNVYNMTKRKIHLIIPITISLVIISGTLYYVLALNNSNLIESTLNTDELNTVSGVSMSEVKLEDEGLIFTLTNDTDYTIYYGTDITLEKNKNDEWYEVPYSGKIGFLAILNYLSPHTEKKQFYSFEVWKGISSGTYRFIKEFYLNETLDEPKYVIKEFELNK